jgi:predicted phage terminase large subunit-like protein
MTRLTTAEEAAFDNAALDEAILRRGKHSLVSFVMRAWEIVEPRRPLQMNWHIVLICDELEKVPEQTRRLVVCIPPGMMKSLLVSVFWPAWLWLKHPEERVIALSGNKRVTSRDSRKMRRIITSTWYQGLISKMHERYGVPTWSLSKDENQKVSFENTLAGMRASMPLGADITGERCDGMIIDDPIDVKDVIRGDPTMVQARVDYCNEIIEQVLPSRLNDPDTSWRVIIMQRLHVNDPAQRAINKGDSHVVLPMHYDPNHPEVNPGDNRAPDELLFPDRYGEAWAEEMRESLGVLQYSAQYEQRARAKTGGVYKNGRFDVTFDHDVQRFKYDEIGLSVDCTFKGAKRSKGKVDFVSMGAFARLGKRRLILNVVRGRMNYPETRQAFKRLCQMFPHARFALIEDKANGSALIDDLGSMYAKIPLIPYEPEASKYERAQLVAPLWEAGLVELPESAPWVSDFVEEMKAFGAGAPNDDQVDMQAQILLRWMTEGTMSAAELIKAKFGHLGVGT